jgi:stage III sporulation protein SpoIIIAA
VFESSFTLLPFFSQAYCCKTSYYYTYYVSSHYRTTQRPGRTCSARVRALSENHEDPDLPPPVSVTCAGDGDECPSLTSNSNEFQDGSVIVRDDLDSLLCVLPENIRSQVACHPQRSELLEVVLDLGRRPEARFLGGKNGGEYLRDDVITKEDLEHAERALGDFGGDNRAGVEGTLHRISAIRNRRGSVVGLTCRVGRAVTGHVDMIRDIVDSPNSILFLGRPGVGKTTVIREMARVLSDELHKRVVIIDTSNEIGGDGDVPHPAIGGARRMQVPDPSQQHRVMIEAVENHMPEIVIVDEIGTEAEALACRTIAERGVQLIGTAHGQVLENLMKNPTLSDLVGGICSVTLGDEEARSRGTQKSVLERKAPPTFPLVIEMRERAMWVAHWVEDSVDCLLNGKIPVVQVRRRQSKSGKVVVEEIGYDQMEEKINGSNPPTSKNPTLRSNEPMDGIKNSVFDSMFGYSEGGFGSSFSSSENISSTQPQRSQQQNSDSGTVYGWAARLRDVSEEEALAELASLGYTDNSRRREKFAFANGTGSGKKKSNKRGTSSRSNARRSSRR